VSSGRQSCALPAVCHMKAEELAKAFLEVMDAVSQGREFQRTRGPLATRAMQHARQPTCTALLLRALGACNSGNTGTASWPGDHYESLRMSAAAAAAAAAAAQIMANTGWAISRDSFQRHVT
jgi:hypothetical protein